MSMPFALVLLWVTNCVPYFAVGWLCQWMDEAGDGKMLGLGSSTT
jgi:hypothetical protein